MRFEKIVVTGLALVICQFAKAGSVSGGGGKSVVCRTPSGAVRSIELLDLWEAKTIYGRKILKSNASTQKQVEAALDSIKFAIATNDFAVSPGPNNRDGLYGADAFRNILKWDTDRLQLKTLPQIHWLKGVHLTLSDDSFESVTPSSCGIEQVVRYDDTSTGGEIYINQDLYEKMDHTNQAAVLIHEAFYAELRHSGEKSSLRVRRTIGLVFSDHHFRPLEEILPNEFYVCSDAWKNSLVLYQSDDPSWKGDIISQVLVADGRRGIDFVGEPTEGWGFKSFDEFFSSPRVGSYTNLGRSVSIDYSVAWVTAQSSVPEKTIKFQLWSSPDQAIPSPETTLKCSLTKKSDFFNH